MLELNERNVYFYEFMLKPKKLAKKYRMSSVFGRIKLGYDANATFKLIRHDTASLRLQDLSLGKEHVCLLINYSDSNLSDPAMQKIMTKDLRVLPKKKGEGLALSTHVVISLKEIKPNVYLGAAEYVPGLPKSLYMGFLCWMMKQYCIDKEFDYEKNRAVLCWPVLDYAILQSEELSDALSGQPLRGVELVRFDEKVIDFDADNEVEVVRQNLYVKPKEEKKKYGQAALQWLKMCATKAKGNDYPVMKVDFKNKVGADTRVVVDTNEQNMADILFGKREVVKLKKKINQSSKSIHTEFSQGIIKLLEAEMENYVHP